ncbi:cytochrome P450 [Streptomyces sp. NPDC047315]|uniref:cytochrome P450 family protein n=1 Tax=Streptomyces sp. NPDC047315 TaxID=3155142 RepID=UPI0033ED6BD7
MIAPYRPDPHGSCPHAANVRLLAQGAVVDVVLPDDVPGMMVLRHEALKEFLAHPDVAKSPEHFALLQQGRIPDGWPLRTFAVVPGMLTADGAAHRRLRSLVSKAFTVRRVEALRPRVEAATERLLDDLAQAAKDSADGRTADLRTHFALPLPLTVISELFGVPQEYRTRLHQLSTRIVSTSIAPQEAIATNREMVQVLATIAAIRAADPGDDLTSALIAVREQDGDRLGDQELIGTLLTFVVAGHETTLNLITNAVRALCRHPEQLDLVRSGAASWSDAVEETLRWDAPVSYFPFRYPVKDVTVDGTTIPAGTPVLAAFSAAGRDPEAYGPDADRFDVRRESPGRHLSLGHGPHYCLGAPLARLEATVALERLFGRLPKLELAVPDERVRRRTGFIGNSVDELLVRVG